MNSRSYGNLRVFVGIGSNYTFAIIALLAHLLLLALSHTALVVRSIFVRKLHAEGFVTPYDRNNGTFVYV